MHAFVREVRLTPKGMMGHPVPHRVSQWCDDKRQEFILLSDTMGVSMLVDAIANPTVGNTTESTVLGPFFRENPPIIANGGDISPGIAGKRVDVDCRVLSEDGTPIVGAQIDCWQASPDGGYDSQMGDGSQHNLRGRLKTDDQGRFWFHTTLPACYPIPDDGPVGELLRQMGRHPWRPGHLHFWVQAPGQQDQHLAGRQVPRIRRGVRREGLAGLRFRRRQRPRQAELRFPAEEGSVVRLLPAKAGRREEERQGGARCWIF